MSKKQSHRLSIELAQGSDPPSEFRIFAAGSNDTVRGVFLFDEASQQSVLAAASDWGNKYSLDYEHDAVNPFLGGPKPAAGWFSIELRGGELWASGVEWTPRASDMLRAREYRYVSPAFDADEEMRVTALVNVALTNLPATKAMTPLVASKEAIMTNDDEKKLADAPPPAPPPADAPADAPPPAADPIEECGDAIENAVTALDACLKACAVVTVAADGDESHKAAAQTVIDAVNAAKAALTEALPAFGGDEPPEGASEVLSLVGARSMKQALGLIAAGQAALVELGVLRAKETESRKASEAQERKDIVARLKADKKITPAQEKWALSVAIDSLRSFAGVAPVIKQLSSTSSTEPAGPAGKRWEDHAPVELAKLHGENPDLYAALKADADQRGAR